MADPAGRKVLNLNVGVLGHVDSGKTSLSRAMSTVASTNAFDKNPQSKERGITLDLGFSSFELPIPDHLGEHGYDAMQVTLVDCPGHASLIRTIIGGAQIIDQMLLVIDITKGIQTQTAECLVIGEITTKQLTVVLNKVDLIKEDIREKHVEKTKAKLRKVFAKTKFKSPEMIVVSARPGGPESDAAPVGVSDLVATIQTQAKLPERDVSGPLLYAVDHCFAIKGQGTVLTGTVLRGTVAVGDDIEIPQQGIVKKVKSMQMFRKPVQRVSMGDRVGMCVTQLDATSMERGVVCKPDSLPTMTAAVARVEKVRFHKEQVKTKAKFHVSVGHDTVMAVATFFGTDSGGEAFEVERDYHWLEELPLPVVDAADASAAPVSAAGSVTGYRNMFVLLEFDSKVVCSPGSLIIGSRLDTDVHSPMCRLAFSGILQLFSTDASYKTTFLPKLRVYKPKVRSGVVDRMMDERTVLGRSLFGKDTALEKFLGLSVELSTGETGVIDSGFGQSGKFKVYVKDGLKPDTIAALAANKKGKKGKGKGKGKDVDVSSGADAAGSDEPLSASITLTLNFRRYVFDPEKALKQHA